MSKVLDYALISAFLEVARTGSLGSAARTLGRSQPLLTHNIRRLEDIMGCRLFDRSPRGATLTPQGEAFAPFAKRLLAVSDEAMRAMAKQSASSSAALRVQISEDLVGESVLKALLENDFAPEMFSWAVTPAGEAPAADAFEKGEVDIFLGDTAPSLADTNVRAVRTARVKLLWAASPVLDVERRPLPFALYPAGCAWRQPIVEALDRDLVDWSIAMESGSLAALQSAARSGVAIIACLPSALSDGLIPLPMETFGLPAPPYVEVAMYRSRWMRRAAVSKQAEEFLWDLTIGYA